MEDKIIKGIYDLAKKEGWLDKLVGLFKKKINVLVLGSSGVGKTNLLDSLTTLTPDIIHHSTRTRDTTFSSLKIEDIPFKFIDTTGQENNSSLRSRAIRENMNSLNIVINVACYGYHEYSTGKKNAFLADGSISNDYLVENREKEINAVKEWSEILGGNAPYRLLTIITKADLWWKNQEEVYNYYEKGEYFKNLGACKQLSPMAIHHCSVFHKLYGEGTLAGNFDENDRILARANLLKTLIEISGNGGKNGK
jgi:energy-coupling factor transporter ATP-binding protein EcfA2